MKSAHGTAILRTLALLAVLMACLPTLAYASNSYAPIDQWRYQWISDEDDAENVPPDNGIWTPATNHNPVTNLPEGYRGMWVHFQVPSTHDWRQPALLVDRLYGHELAVYQGDRLLFQSERDFAFDLNKLLVRVERSSGEKDYYLRILANGERAGLISAIRVGEIEELSLRYTRQDLPDLLFGASIVFLSLIMLVCFGYLHRKQRSSWLSLCLIALSVGILIVGYSPLTYIYFKECGDLFLFLFDLALFALIPSFNFYVDQVFEGQSRAFTKYRRLQTGYSVFCLLALIVYTITDKHYGVYYIILNVILGAMIFAQLLFIIGLSLKKAIGGNRDAVLLAAGIVLFSASAATDMLLYYASHKTYLFVLWKYGVIVLILSLVIIFARRISSDYGKLLNYSKELELYNHTLQRTEKMKIISDLAASVAHEVRNPLQVTRGFLQLLSGRSDEGSKSYFELATNELDRASEIITDFLTFAKPDLERVVPLDLADEMKKIEAMMSPLAAMHGALLSFRIQSGLFVNGNSSKLKQALINIIKNSLEALDKEGWIRIVAVAEGEEAVVRIEDNGGGMEQEEVAQLGIPFFSMKTKGTGLGLMVTFRIIEAMRGSILFRSVKTKGTEVEIRFPLKLKV